MVFQGNMDDTKTTKLRGLLHYLEKNGIAAEEGLSYADGDEQFYKELLGIFAKEKEKKQHHLEKAFQSLNERSCNYHRFRNCNRYRNDERIMENIRNPVPWTKG